MGKPPPIRKTSRGVEMVAVNWLIPLEVWERLDELAAEDERSMAGLARRILLDWVKAHGA